MVILCTEKDALSCIHPLHTFGLREIRETTQTENENLITHNPLIKKEKQNGKQFSGFFYTTCKSKEQNYGQRQWSAVKQKTPFILGTSSVCKSYE